MSVHVIKQVVADHFGIHVTDIDRRDRRPKYAWPRQVAMFIARELTFATYKQLGEEFDNRDHGTVVWACDLVNWRATNDRRDGEMINELMCRAQYNLRPRPQYWII